MVWMRSWRVWRGVRPCKKEFRIRSIIYSTWLLIRIIDDLVYISNSQVTDIALRYRPKDTDTRTDADASGVVR